MWLGDSSFMALPIISVAYTLAMAGNADRAQVYGRAIPAPVPIPVVCPPVL